jgi:hypothetical protein
MTSPDFGPNLIVLLAGGVTPKPPGRVLRAIRRSTVNGDYGLSSARNMAIFFKANETF